MLTETHVIWVPRGRTAEDVIEEIVVFGRLVDPPRTRYLAAWFPRWRRWQRLWGSYAVTEWA